MKATITKAKSHHWYADHIGETFPVYSSLFGYKVSEGEHKDKLIYKSDCALRQTELTYNEILRLKHINSHPKVKTQNKAI